MTGFFSGVGRKTGELLSAAGIENLEQLRAAPVEDVEAVGIQRYVNIRMFYVILHVKNFMFQTSRLLLHVLSHVTCIM